MAVFRPFGAVDIVPERSSRRGKHVKHLIARVSGIVVASAVGLAVMAAPALAAKPTASQLPALTSDLTGSVTRQTSVTFTWTTTPAVTETYSCTLDGVKVSCGTGTGGSKTYTGLLGGSHNFVLRAKQSGHFRSVTTTRTWTIDLTPPQAPTVQPVTSPTKNTSASVSFTDADPTVNHYVCSLDGGTETTCISPYVVTGLASGAHTASVIAVDAVGNRSTPGTTTWTVDATAPGSPVFTQQPANPTNATTATFAWNSDADVAGSTCSLDGATATACTSPQTRSGLAAGTHTFSVTDQDSLGNANTTQVTWVVDLTPPPAPQIVNGPATSTDQNSAAFTFSDAELATTFLCSLDGAAFSTCTSPTSYPSLFDGGHQFQVEAVDAAGNTSSATPYDWTIDSSTTGPALSPPAFIAGPPAFTNLGTVSFSWLGLDDTTTGFLCSLDGSTFASCPGPDANGDGSKTVTVTTESLHVFAVKATDGTNLSPATTWSWTYDHTPPAAPSFSTTPPSTSNSRTAVFSFASDANAQFTCSLDSATATLCASPVTLQDLADGSHSFTVVAMDAAGNTSQSSYPWSVDLAAPAAPAITGPTGYTNTSAADISWTDSDAGATFSCALDGAAAQSCTSPVSPTGLADRVHTFVVTATNASSKTAASQISWTVDTIKPVLSVANIPVEGSLISSMSVAPDVTQTEVNPGSLVCALAGPTPSNTCGPYLDLADGAYTLTVNTTDLAGNAADAVVRHWTVDATKPAISLFNVPAEGATVNTTSVNPNIAQTDAHPGALVCALAGPTSSSTCGPYANLAEGAYTLTVSTTDLAGNAADTVVRHWTVDTTKPVISVANVPAEGSSVNTQSVSPTVTQAEAHPGALVCSLAGATPSSTCGPYSGLADGAYTLTVNTTDLAGNSADAVVRHWTVDTTAPSAPTVTQPGSTPNPTITLTGEAGSSFLCSIDGGPFTACTSPFTPPAGLNDGNHTLVVETVDAAGNISQPSQPVTFVVATAPGSTTDKTPPTATIVATTTLTGASTATFSEPVHALTASGAAMVLTGTSTVVPTSVVCRSGSSAVACGGSFNSLRLTPKSALVPGQHYTIRLLAGAVQDGNANPLVAKSAAFRASRAEQETSAAARTLWSALKAKAAYGGSLVHENTAGASATYSFTGTNVTWWTTSGPNQGKASVFIDGVRKAVVNNYATAAHFKVARKFGKLANKRHTLRIVVRGVKGAKAGTGTFVAVDAFSVGKNRVNTPALRMTWRTLAAKQLSGGHAFAAKTKGDALTFTFRGTGISWLTERSRNQGKVAVFVDGVRKATVDNYAAVTKFGVKRTVTGLSDKLHTLKLVVLGTHHTGGTGTWVTVDRFLVS
jgi:hypothetical protein